MWTVKSTSTGVRRWQKPRKTTTTKKPVPAVARTSTARTHKILFCEPYVVRARSGLRGGVRFAVSDKFYPALLRAPRSLHTRRSTFDIGNAYIFGKRFPLDSYKLVGSCGNDGGQIGFIDLDEFDTKVASSVSDVVLEEYGMNKVGRLGIKATPWENRPALRRVRKIIPHILFMGDTDGGDVGADLYAHWTAGKIDGLIIDNEYFFQSEE